MNGLLHANSMIASLPAIYSPHESLGPMQLNNAARDGISFSSYYLFRLCRQI